MDMMNFNFMPSLEYTALVKVASTLWNQDDIRDLIASFGPLSPLVSEIPTKQRNKAIKKISRLSLPGLLKKKLIDLVNPIGLGILKWRLYHELDFPENFFDASLNKLCWTQQGTVDRKATAEVLVKDGNTDIAIRYKLACMYCLQNDIPLLWDEMPERLRKLFYRNRYKKHEEETSYEVIWAYDLKGKLNELIHRMGKFCDLQKSPYQCGFDTAMFTANRVAAEHFFQRLTPEEKNKSFAQLIKQMDAVNSTWRSLCDFIPKEYFVDLLCFLLPQMTEEQQTEMFRRHSYHVLFLFLDCSLQSLFMRLANSVWTFLSTEDYHRLLSIIVDRAQIDKDYRKVLSEFWIQSPNSFKNQTLNSLSTLWSLLSRLFCVGDKNNISLILEEVNIQGKKDIVDFGKTSICAIMGHKHELNLLDFLIEEYIPSDSSVIALKEAIKKHLIRSEKTPKGKEAMCNRFYENINHTEKRKAEQESIRGSKRLCTKFFGKLAYNMWKNTKSV